MVTKKQKRSSRKRMVARRRAYQGGVPVFLLDREGQQLPANRGAIRQAISILDHANSESRRQKAKEKRKRLLTKARRVLAKVAREARRLQRQLRG